MIYLIFRKLRIIVVCPLVLVFCISDCQKSTPYLAYKFDVKPLAVASSFHLTISIAEKNVVISDDGTEIGVLGKSPTGDIIMIDDDDRIALKLFGQKKFPDNASLTKPEDIVLSRAIGLLHSWPNNLPVSLVSSPNRIILVEKEEIVEIQISKQIIDQKTSKILPTFNFLESPSSIKRKPLHLLDAGVLEMICDDMYNIHSGDYTLISGRKESFNQVVGDIKHCFGRCGAGCPWIPGHAYTQACFNHDGCVGKLGLVHAACNRIFAQTVFDYRFAPNCTVHPH